MLQNAKVTGFNISELLRENQLGGGGKFTLPFSTQIRVNKNRLWHNCFLVQFISKNICERLLLKTVISLELSFLITYTSDSN